ncbi:Opine oxidase subunit A [Rhodovastum atsumiense]|uniref:FAD-dependent oxidoreductase n=1 Tax=Rhodovastum atsumiense TaxID=504468 RepID=UPI001EF071D6|nr:FAD-dependent oxidoreductase [Rhodovastum atsumiense]CAH2598754.1 Opine oxidase subunit A [Rhodovastum atsumiense]
MSRVDLVIVGAGPAGLAAAIEARGLGLDTLVIDEQPAPGGQVWRAIERRARAGEAVALGAAYAAGAAVVARFRASGAAYRPGARVWQIESGGRVFVSAEGRSEVVEAGAVLLATGAQERPVPFPGWLLPGVLTVGAAQILLKTSWQVPEGPVWIAGSGPLVALYAVQVLRAGGHLAGILDTTPPGLLRRAAGQAGAALRGVADLLAGLGWLARLRLAGVRIVPGVREFAAEGDDRLCGLRYRTAAGGAVRREPAAVLLVHEGVVPAIHPTLLLGCDHDWDAAQGSFRPRLGALGETSRPGIFVAGDLGGIGGATAALARGRLAAIGIAARAGRLDEAAARRRAAPVRAGLGRALAVRPLLDALYPPPARPLADDTVVCRCEGLTAGAIRAAARIGRPGPNQVKAFTRCGMGPCQGRQCGLTLSALLAETQGATMAEIGSFRVRPPLAPISLDELAALADMGE